MIHAYQNQVQSVGLIQDFFFRTVEVNNTPPWWKSINVAAPIFATAPLRQGPAGDSQKPWVPPGIPQGNPDAWLWASPGPDQAATLLSFAARAYFDHKWNKLDTLFLPFFGLVKKYYPHSLWSRLVVRSSECDFIKCAILYVKTFYYWHRSYCLHVQQPLLSHRFGLILSFLAFPPNSIPWALRLWMFDGF